MVDSREASGLRRSPFNILTDEEISFIKDEIRVIEADESIFRFNISGRRTSYSDKWDLIFINGDVLPNTNSNHPRDLLSVRAVLAHEYYGHRQFRSTSTAIGSWNDEFRASYNAAKNTPNLSGDDRHSLILDALQWAKDAGVSIIYNSFIRRILYGDDYI